MAGKEKACTQVHGKNAMQDLIKSIVDTLWSYDNVKRTVNNNYIILQAIVRNTVKSLNINTDNFDIEAFNDNFDIHVLDLKTQDTLADSLAKVLSKFIIVKVDNNVDKTMEMAPSMIESRLREVMDYVRKNPQDAESIDYAKELVKQLREFDRALAAKYSRELESIVNPKPKVETEPKPVVRVIPAPKVDVKPEPVIDDNGVLKPVTESRLKQIKSYQRLRPKLRELREETAMAIAEIKRQRKREIDAIEDMLRSTFELLRDPRESKNWNEYVEGAKALIERLRELDPQKASEYEEMLKIVINMDGIEFVLRNYLIYIKVGAASAEYYIRSVREWIEKLRKVDPKKAGEYERRLNTILYERRKYANYGKEGKRERRVRIHHASYKITDFNEAGNDDADKPWERHVRGILKWTVAPQ